MLLAVKGIVLVMEHITQLIGNTLSVAYLDINIIVRMPVYPKVYAACHDVILQLYGERTIYLTANVLGAKHLE